MGKKSIGHLIFLLVLIALTGCSSDSTSTSATSTSSAAAEAEFAALTEAAIPAAFKTGGSSSDIREKIANDIGPKVAPGCTSGSSCNMVDSTYAGELFMKVWAMDYNSECNDTMIAAGTCFNCPACNASSGTNYLKPTMLTDPSSCATTNSSDGTYVNFGMDPCLFDYKVAQISNFGSCSTNTIVNIASAVPWASSWSLPSSIEFNGYDSTNSFLWGLINGSSSTGGKYIASLTSEYMYFGLKDVENNYFMFFGLGSASTSMGSDGPSLIGYAGSVSGDKVFETIQIRNQGTNKYVVRVRSNSSGSHIYMQQWNDDQSGGTPGANDLDTSVTAAAGNPDYSYCAKMGTTVATSTFVELSECITAFSKSSQTELDAESGYYFKLIPFSQLAAVDFTASLVTNTEDSCL